MRSDVHLATDVKLVWRSLHYRQQCVAQAEDAVERARRKQGFRQDEQLEYLLPNKPFSELVAANLQTRQAPEHSTSATGVRTQGRQQENIKLQKLNDDLSITNHESLAPAQRPGAAARARHG